MSEHQTIIVYRNQMEKDFYENGGPTFVVGFIFFYVIGVLIAFHAVRFISYRIGKDFHWFNKEGHYWYLTIGGIPAIIFLAKWIGYF